MTDINEAAARANISATFAMMEMIRELGTFSERDILTRLAARGLPPFVARQFFHHVIDGMVGKTVTERDGIYTYREDEPKTIADHMQGFRDLLSNPRS